MSPSPLLPHSFRAAALALLVGASTAQEPKLSLSVDWHGPLQGTPDSSGGTPITAGDVLTPFGGDPAFGPLPPPELLFSGGLLGIGTYAACVGAGPGDPCLELDALSYGKDAPFTADPLTTASVLFSVDEYATGLSLPGPSIFTEAPVGDVCADILTTLLLPPPPVPPTGVPNHIGLVDGDGLVSGSSALYVGWGGTEPNVPGSGLPDQPSDPGDNLDALDIGALPDPALDSIYFSLDSAFFDSAAGVFHTGSAAANGFVGGDVLERAPGGSLSVYAPAALLGLDQAGPDSDDLDALILLENGVPGYQPSLTPFDWMTGATDMLAFSVRRGSDVVGKLDSLQGIPILPGDILVPPVFGGNGNPGVLIAAEALGMSTQRSQGESDELDGMDSGSGADSFLDCNDNGVEDAVDIGNGTSDDDNLNGVPDECESSGTASCFCAADDAPCSNEDPAAGCANSTGAGAYLLGTGTSSLVTDDLVLSTIQMPQNGFGITFMGSGTTQTPLGAGIRCAGGSLYRYPVFFTGSGGTATLGPGIGETSCDQFGQGGCIQPGSTWTFQTWYRDIHGPCGTSNLSNAWTVTFTP